MTDWLKIWLAIFILLHLCSSVSRKRHYKTVPDPDPKKGGGGGGQSSRPLDKWGARSPLRAPPLDPPLQK